MWCARCRRRDSAASPITGRSGAGSIRTCRCGGTSSRKRRSCRSSSPRKSGGTSDRSGVSCRRKPCSTTRTHICWRRQYDRRCRLWQPTIRTPTSRREPPAHDFEHEVLDLDLRAKRESLDQERLHLGDRAGPTIDCTFGMRPGHIDRRRGPVQRPDLRPEDGRREQGMQAQMNRTRGLLSAESTRRAHHCLQFQQSEKLMRRILFSMSALVLACATSSPNRQKSETQQAQGDAQKQYQEAANAQKRAAEEQQKAEQAEREVTKAQKALADAQATLAGQRAKAAQAQRDAAQSARDSQERGAQMQQRAAQLQGQEARQGTQTQEGNQRAWMQT